MLIIPFLIFLFRHHLDSGVLFLDNYLCMGHSGDVFIGVLGEGVGKLDQVNPMVRRSGSPNGLLCFASELHLLANSTSAGLVALNPRLEVGWPNSITLCQLVNPIPRAYVTCLVSKSSCSFISHISFFFDV